MSHDLSRRLSVEEVADLMRQHGFPVIGDDVAWLAKHGVVLDFPPQSPDHARFTYRLLVQVRAWRVRVRR